MYARKSTFLVLTVLLFSSWSGMVSASPQGTDSIQSPNHDNYHFEKWSPLEFASEHVHQIRQTSGLIHSPYGSFDPLMDEYPTFGAMNTGDYTYSDRPVFVIQSESSDISGISSSVEEVGGAILDYMPDSALLARLPVDVDADNFLVSLANVRWSGQMPDIWRVSPEILGNMYSPSSQLNLQILPANDLTIEELISLERDLSLISGYDQSTNCDAWLCTVESVDSIWIPLLSKDWRILHIQTTSIASVYLSLIHI